MKLGISSYTYPWAIGLPGAPPTNPSRLTAHGEGHELGVGIVQFGPNMPLDKLPEKELREVVKHADSWKIDLEIGTVGFDPPPAVPNPICATHWRHPPENHARATRRNPSDADGDCRVPTRYHQGLGGCRNWFGHRQRAYAGAGAERIAGAVRSPGWEQPSTRRHPWQSLRDGKFPFAY